jgi:hypothetical protein
MPSSLAKNMIDGYEKDLAKVMAELEAEVLTFMGGAGTTSTEAAATILNSRPAFLQMLNDSGYNELSSQYVAQFGEVPDAVSRSFAARALPAPEFTTVSAETFSGLARMDLQGFSAIGTKAMDDLRLGIYRQTIGGFPFKDIVKTIKESTVGIDGKLSPLANHSYTHANTAILNFNGEVTKEAGESIGFGEDDSLWEAVGPLDDKTRDVCQAALNDPVRTKAEWIEADYWGGAPGGWNCRHELFPYIGEE